MNCFRQSGPVFLLLAGCLSSPCMALAQDAATPQSMTAAEKAEKQIANEEAERLCRSIKDPDKFNECLDLYFLDAAKFQAFLEKNGVSRPVKADR